MANDSKRTKLDGGNMTTIYKDGATVNRSQGPWSPTVQRLLRHLEAEGFDSSPRFLGINDNNEEILTFIEGDCLKNYPEGIEETTHLIGMRNLGAQMRALHDATVTFEHREGDVWMLTYDGELEKEVICHNDIAPYNTIFEKQMPHKFIDFDTSCPGPRIWDIAYALYRFVPFSKEAPNQETLHLRACLEAYFEGYGIAQPADLFDIMKKRLLVLANFILQAASAGDVNFKKMLEEGHRDLYLSEAEYIEQNQKLWL